MRLYAAVVVAGLWPIAAFPSHAAPYQVDPNASVFAVVTQKAGPAAAFAHNHLVFPRDYEADVALDDDQVSRARFRLRFPTETLVADDPAASARWYASLQTSGILQTPFSEISPSDRAKIRDTMLSAKQLDAAAFPEITAELVSIAERPAALDAKTHTHDLEVALTVHGKTVTRTFQAAVALDDGVLTVEAVGRYRFTDFGVKPYSAFLGAVRNQDEFSVYVRLRARRGEG